MKLKHDKIADAIYIKLGNMPYAYGKDLDDLRRIDYASDNTPRGVELLCVSGGVNLDSLPHAGEIAEMLEAEGIKIYEMIKYSYTAPENPSVIFDVKLASPTREQQGHTAALKQEATA